jgi:hypothetical protein
MIRLEAGNDAMGSMLWIEALVITTRTVKRWLALAGIMWRDPLAL